MKKIGLICAATLMLAAASPLTTATVVVAEETETTPTVSSNPVAIIQYFGPRDEMLTSNFEKVELDGSGNYTISAKQFEGYELVQYFADSESLLWSISGTTDTVTFDNEPFANGESYVLITFKYKEVQPDVLSPKNIIINYTDTTNGVGDSPGLTMFSKNIVLNPGEAFTPELPTIDGYEYGGDPLRPISYDEIFDGFTFYIGYRKIAAPKDPATDPANNGNGNTGGGGNSGNSGNGGTGTTDPGSNSGNSGNGGNTTPGMTDPGNGGNSGNGGTGTTDPGSNSGNSGNGGNTTPGMTDPGNGGNSGNGGTGTTTVKPQEKPASTTASSNSSGKTEAKTAANTAAGDSSIIGWFLALPFVAFLLSWKKQEN